MGSPSQVRAGLCLIAALAPSLSFGSSITSNAQAQQPPAACVDPVAYARSVVSITWYFDQARRDGIGNEIIGERATAWFYTSSRLLVTAAHFANELSPQDWQDVELRQTIGEEDADVMTKTQLRVLAQGDTSRVQGHGADIGPGAREDVAILELRDPFPNAQVLEIEPEAPATDAAVLVLGYPRGRMQAAQGIVRKIEDPAGKYAGMTLLEVQGDNRLLLNGGASGAPVLNCRLGRVVAVLNGLLTGPTLPLLPPEHAVIPTAWGSPTNTAIPVSTLTALWGRILARHD